MLQKLFKRSFSIAVYIVCICCCDGVGSHLVCLSETKG